MLRASSRVENTRSGRSEPDAGRPLGRRAGPRDTAATVGEPRCRLGAEVSFAARFGFAPPVSGEGVSGSGQRLGLAALPNLDRLGAPVQIVPVRAARYGWDRVAPEKRCCAR